MAKKRAGDDNGYVCKDSVKLQELADVLPDDQGAEERREGEYATAKRPKR